jgi:DNA-directed RNA polymerase subunit RPC12/RpoP
MQQSNSILCPSCNNSQLLLKYEVSYEYSYAIDANAPGECNRSEFLPYLYDNREQKESHQYIQCQTCGAKFPCCFDHWDQGISAEALQKAINSTSKKDSSNVT